MKRVLLALLFVMIAVGARAQSAPCVPTQATPNQPGCWTQATSVMPNSTDFVMIWRGSQFPNSSQLITPSNLNAAFGGPFLPLVGGTMTGPIQGINTTDPGGFRQNGNTILRVFGNAGNMFGDGPGTVTLVGIGAGANLNQNDYLTTAVGWHALFASTQSNSESTAIGWNAQNAITTGGFNTTLGVNTAGTCQSCVHLLGIGTDALRNTVTASYDLAIGVSTLLNDGSAGNNIAIGDSAYESNASASGQFNIAIGFGTFQGLSLTTAANNVIVGTGIGDTATSATNNNIIGHIAASSLTSGSANEIIGKAALALCTNCSNNIVIGDSAAARVTTGSQNIVVGPQVAPTNLATGQHNILIGTSSAIDTAAAGTNFTINIENIWEATGTAAPATSVSVIAGLLQAGGSIAAGANSANILTLAGATTANPPTLTSSGSDTNVGMEFVTKGSGTYSFFGGAGGVSSFEVTPVANVASSVNVTAAPTSSNVLIDVAGTATGLNIGANIATSILLGSSSSPVSVPAKVTLGLSGSLAGAVGFLNATSGSITVSPPTGALGTQTLTLPDATGTIFAGSFAANGAVATALTSLGPTGSHTTVQEWLAVPDAGGTIRYVPGF